MEPNPDAGAGAPPTRPRRRFRTPRAKHFAVATGVSVALLALSLWVLGREATLIYVAEKAVERSNGRLHLADIRGSLLGTIRLRELRFQDKFGTLAISDAHLDWKPLRLLRAQIAVGEVSAADVALELVKSEDKKLEPPASLAAPFSFAVDDFRIGRLTIASADGRHELRDLHAAFAGSKRRLQGEIKSLATQWGDVKARVKLGAKAPFDLEGGIEIVAPDPNRYSVVTKLGGSLLNAEATVDARAYSGSAAAKLLVAPFEAQPLTQLEFLARDFDPREWIATAPAASLSGEGHLVADAERKLNGALALANAQPGTIDQRKLPFARFSAMLTGTLKDLALADLRLDLAQAGQFRGSGALRDGGLHAALDTRNFNLRGLQGRLHRTQLAGNLAVGADAASQRLRFNLSQGRYRFRFAGALAEGVVRVEDAYARAGAAELATRGRLAFDANKNFAVAGTLRNFDPSQFGAYPAQRINSRFDVRGQVEPVVQVAASVNLADSQLFGQPASGRGTFRSRRVDQPEVDVDFTVRVGETQASAKGTLHDPAKLGSMDLQLTLAGGSLAELYDIVGVPLPGTPPYRVSGRLLHEGERWEFRKFAGRVGESDLAGDFLIDRARKPQFMKANLTSNRLVLADLAGFVGAEKTPTGKVETPNSNRVLPDNPYNLEKLKAADADVRFNGRRIVTERLPVDNMSAHLLLKGGVLTLAPLNFGAAGGTLVSTITLDGRGQVIASRADIRVQGMQLGELMPKLKVSQASVGELDGRIRLASRGNSVAAMLGSANGDSALVVGEGEVSDLIMRLANLDVANTLLVLMRGDKKIDLRCMVADFQFENGVMRPRQFVFDTAHTTLVGEGQVNFSNETLNLRLVARPKDRSLLSLRGPIVVGGTFADPSVLPDMKQLALRGAAATALAVVAAPLAAIVPFIQLGEKNEVQCGPLVQQAKRTIHQGTAVAQR